VLDEYHIHNFCNAEQDELLWAAAWLHKATRDRSYLQFVLDNQGSSSAVNEFGWDNKFAGAQILLAEVTSSYTIDILIQFFEFYFTATKY